jgi:hypothetical protein
MHGVFCPDFPILPQLSIKRYLCGILSFFVALMLGVKYIRHELGALLVVPW